MSDQQNRVSVELTLDECAEVLNSVVFTAFHAMEDNDESAWHSVDTSVAVANKLEEAYPDLIEHDDVLCVKELLVIRRQLARHRKAQRG